jgi:DNA (cytosine-5)-methyltransferase 1
MKLRVGTDCSGIEAPIYALKQLGVDFVHEFSSDIDRHCRASIMANYKPRILFNDMMERTLEDVPDIDLYVCGFPCQPFSVAGLRKGVQDCRGQIVFKCIELIKVKRPQYYVLENVPGLLSNQGGELFEYILSKLEAIEGYNVKWKVLNTKDFGIPQNRRRLFIVGSLKGEFSWPEPCTEEGKSLADYIDYSDTRISELSGHVKRQGLMERIPRDSVFVDFSWARDSCPNAGKIAPCLLASGRLWNVQMERRANVREYLDLQGFPRNFKQVVSDTQLKKQAGNSMSVCVLEALFEQMHL